ncbi:MAG: transporter, partial [bacterium]
PSQTGHYAPAVINVRDMAYPPPGLFILAYNLWLGSDTYVDRYGESLPSELKLDASAFATVPAVFWGSSFSLLGGARYLVGVSPNYFTADGRVIFEEGEGDSTVARVEEGSVSGWSDLFISPVTLCWALTNFDLTFSYGFAAPTGRYNTGADDNVGLGFWTHQFQGYGYYYPSPSKATALMLALTYELNGKIKDADVNPGNRLSLEWGLSQYLTEQFEVTVQGGHNWQISDDSGSDVYWDPSFHDRKNTIAFGGSFWPWPDWLNISLKYAFDFGARGRLEADYWMLNLIFLTNTLTGE